MRTKWNLAYKPGGKHYPPPKEGMYWVTDGYYVEIGYWHPDGGWGLSNGTKWNPTDDWNFDVRYWREISPPKITKRVIKITQG